MSLPTEIQDALHIYDNNKGFWRRLFGRDHAAIRALRTLSNIDQTNLLKIYQCFIENLPKPAAQEPYKVFQAILIYLKKIDFPAIPEVMDELYRSKLLKQNDLDILKSLDNNQFQNLASILKKLSTAQLLTQQNLACISPYYETPEKLSIIDSAMAVAINNPLKQEAFSKLFKLLNDNNQFLLSDAAYNLVWRPLETQFTILFDIDEIFNKLNLLIQQENPAEKIENYMRELNSAGSSPRKRHDVKFYTAPPRSRCNTGDSLASNQSVQLTRQQTL